MKSPPETTLTWEDVLASDWFLSSAGSFLSFADLHYLSSTSKQCRNKVHAWIITWPKCAKDLFCACCQLQPPSSLLVFGLHNCSKAFPLGYVEQLRPNPSPILQFSFASMTFDVSKAAILGAWSLLSIANEAPDNLGRTAPNVCAVDDEGSKIFYCGGNQFAAKNEGQWLTVSEMNGNCSSSTAIFDVKTSSWKSLAPMPVGVCNAGICRLGSLVYIIGGETGSYGNNREVLCFDLETEAWVPAGIPSFPGRAYGGYATIASSNHTILVAGGGMVTDWNHMIGPCREVFSLDVTSCIWTRVADLPDSDYAAKKCTGFLRQSANNDTSCVVVSGKQTVQLLSSGHWDVLPGFRNGPGCVASFGNTVVSSWLSLIELVLLEDGVHLSLPAQCNAFRPKAMEIVDAAGQTLLVCLSGIDRIVPVYR
ncbi:expressed unknown protein [Seminavis robusta]|uniref:Uncharacterized protein n=1 Tax=Seminavis robusta TaxID=568900 RepID=A0A9N8EK99_9STRA|nr:expressed unknown protein [Seminavis robusta]|eukprot:Sro1398_g269300.1 n/a (423) ;mRNA; r:23900-25168